MFDISPVIYIGFALVIIKNQSGIIAILNEDSVGYVTLATLPVAPGAVCQPACGSCIFAPEFLAAMGFSLGFC